MLHFCKVFSNIPHFQPIAQRMAIESIGKISNPELDITFSSPRQLFCPYITMQPGDEIPRRQTRQNQSTPVL
jgi:hypothetical protein